MTDRYRNVDAALDMARKVYQCPGLEPSPTYKLVARGRDGTSGLNPHEAAAAARQVLDAIIAGMGSSPQLAWICAKYWKVFSHVPGVGHSEQELQCLAFLRSYVIGRLPTGIHFTRAVQGMIVNHFLPQERGGVHQMHPAWTSQRTMREELRTSPNVITAHAQTVRHALIDLGIIAMGRAHELLDAAGMLEEEEQAA